MSEGTFYLGAIRSRRKKSKRSGGPNGTENLLADLGQIHSASLEQQKRDQEENPRAIEPFAQIAIEQVRISQNCAEREQIRLHFNSNPKEDRDQDRTLLQVQSPFHERITETGFFFFWFEI